MCFFFFFKQKTAYEMRISDWSSDVCSSDLAASNAVEKAVRRRRVDLAVLHQKHVGTGRLRNQATIVEHKGVGIPLALGGVLGKGANHVDAGRLGSRSEEHTSELQSLMRISNAVFGLKKMNNKHDIVASVTIT